MGRKSSLMTLGGGNLGYRCDDERLQIHWDKSIRPRIGRGGVKDTVPFKTCHPSPKPTQVTLSQITSLYDLLYDLL